MSKSTEQYGAYEEVARGTNSSVSHDCVVRRTFDLTIASLVVLGKQLGFSRLWLWIRSGVSLFQQVRTSRSSVTDEDETDRCLNISHRDDSYYYQNPDESTYYDDGKGTGKYTSPGGKVSYKDTSKSSKTK